MIFAKNIHYSSSDAYFKYLTISNSAWLVLSFFLRTYATSHITNFEIFTKRTIQEYLLWIIFLLIYLFFFRELSISRLFIIATSVAFGVGLLINRFIYLGIFSYFRHSDFLVKKVLILGYNDTAKRLVQYFEQEGLNMQILGYIEDEENISELSNYPVLANISDTIQIAKEMEVQEIYSTISPEQNKGIYDLMYRSEEECIRFRIVPNLSIFITREVHIEYLGELPVLSLRKEPLDDIGNRIKKRILDLFASLLVTVFILSWLMPIIGLIILLESGRPIFFKQQRTGKNKKSFYCWKFRSMKSNKDADLKQATKADDRITRFGKFLRKTSLDEFPQFINVIRGEMSLVGPRPHMLKHTSDYSKVVDEYMVRQFIKPGITGWAQINGYRGEITNPEQIKMRVNKDVWYLENWTLWLDIKILFLTVYYILKGDVNAY
jgi:putative colanic acid biosynthesis UDP-glucose lipid carrier transferase